MNRFFKLIGGAAAGFGLLALVFTGKGRSEDEGANTEARASAASPDQMASVRSPPGPEGSGEMGEELEGTDLFVG